MSALDIFEVQVEAFNEHDVERFLATYSEEAAVVGAGPEPLVGMDSLRAFYTPRLKDRSVHCAIDSVVLFGDRWVVARETVSNSAGATETIATFEVIGGLIQRASMLKASSASTR